MILIPVPWLPSAQKGFTTWAITISPFVLILKSKKDDKAILAHEERHLQQIRDAGWWSWYYRYLFRPEFRRAQEAEGYAIQREVENA